MADGINIESPDELDISRVWEADASSTGRTGQPSESEPAIAGRETRTILGIKILFVFVLCLSAAGALGVYFYISARENSEFEAQFSDDATKVLAAIGATIDFSLGTADAFVASIISTGKATNQTYVSFYLVSLLPTLLPTCLLTLLSSFKTQLAGSPLSLCPTGRPEQARFNL